MAGIPEDVSRPQQGKSTGAEGQSRPQPDAAPRWTRRNLLKGVGVAAVSTEAMLGRATAAATAPAAAQPLEPNQPVTGPIPITLNINGQDRTVTVEPRTTLLSALRDRLDPALTGSKLVCDAGTCGACTVLLDGRPVYGCSVLAIDAVGRKVTTVEGLATEGQLSPVQAAFVDQDAMMCGFCTPGFVMSVTALLRQNPSPTLQEVREACQGNFCRCGTYPHIFTAALAAAKGGRPAP